MNKVISINIGGSIFQIEDQAFDALNKYLLSLKEYFGSSASGQEIIADIENRIAELFQTKIVTGKAAINSEDVTETIDSMGRPEDFAKAEEENGSTQETHTGTGSPINTANPGKSKRLYRDGEGRIIGGVAGGLAYYFNIDPAWARLAFVILFFFGGTSIPLYIILWVVMPEAKTTSEKLEMKGENITVSNIEKSVKEEFSKVKENLEANDFWGKVKGFIVQFVDLMVALLKGLINFVSKIFGVIVLIIGIAFLIGFLSLMLGGADGLAGIQIDGEKINWSKYVFEQNSDKVLAYVGIGMLLLSVSFGLIWAGIKTFARHLRLPERWMGISLFALFLVGLICSISAGIRVSTHFKEGQSIKTTIALDSSYTTLYINSDDFGNNRLKIEDNTLSVSDVGLEIKRTANKEISLTEIRSARGRTNSAAKQNAGFITIDLKRQDSILDIPSHFNIGENNPYRLQRLKYVLRIPEGVKVVLNNHADGLLEGTENISGYDFSDLEGKTLIMTNSGIKCSNCETETYSSSLSDLPKASEYEKSFNLGDFSNLTMEGNYKLTLVRDGKHRIYVNGEDEKWKIKLSGNTLKMEQEDNWFNLGGNHNQLEVFISMPSAEKISLNGVGKADIKGFETGDVDLSLAGSVDARMNAEFETLKIKVAGASNIRLKGKVDKLEVDAAGACKIKAYDCEVNTAQVDMAGACNAYLNVKKRLNIDIAGACHVTYRGNPENLETSTSGASSIDKENSSDNNIPEVPEPPSASDSDEL